VNRARRPRKAEVLACPSEAPIRKKKNLRPEETSPGPSDGRVGFPRKFHDLRNGRGPPSLGFQWQKVTQRLADIFLRQAASGWSPCQTRSEPLDRQHDLAREGWSFSNNVAETGKCRFSPAKVIQNNSFFDAVRSGSICSGPGIECHGRLMKIWLVRPWMPRGLGPLSVDPQMAVLLRCSRAAMEIRKSSVFAQGERRNGEVFFRSADHLPPLLK